MDKLYNISKTAEILDVTPKTLRIWDKEGKLKPVLTSGGHRRYKESDINNIINVRSMDKTFKIKELQQFVHDHIQSKVNHNELHLVGFDMNNVDNFKREYEIYENTLLEGLINGIIMCGYSVECIEIK